MVKKETLLFIGVGFHNFDKFINDDLSNKYDVVYINSKEYIRKHPVKSKLFTYLGGKWLSKACEKLIMKQLFAIKQPVTKLFVIKGDYLTNSHLDYISARFLITEKVLYLWDSWYYHKNIEDIYTRFDKIYSFDSRDCKEKKLILRPLFYFSSQIRQSTNKTIDIAFVGGDHSDRYLFLRKMKKMSVENGLTYSFHLLVGRVAFFEYTHRCLFKSKYDEEDSEFIKGQSISYNEYVDIVSNSKVIIDMPATGQIGLTMRTIEALSMGTRLLTTNTSILEYDDIPQNSYMVLTDNTQTEDIINFINNTNEKFVLPKRYESSYALNEMI